jgi:hypothetical protein
MVRIGTPRRPPRRADTRDVTHPVQTSVMRLLAGTGAARETIMSIFGALEELPLDGCYFNCKCRMGWRAARGAMQFQKSIKKRLVVAALTISSY